MLQTKSEGASEEEETDEKAEPQVGTGSVDESETREMTQQERVKIKVDNNGNLWAQRIWIGNMNLFYINEHLSSPCHSNVIYYVYIVYTYWYKFSILTNFSFSSSKLLLSHYYTHRASRR